MPHRPLNVALLVLVLVCCGPETVELEIPAAGARHGDGSPNVETILALSREALSSSGLDTRALRHIEIQPGVDVGVNAYDPDRMLCLWVDDRAQMSYLVAVELSSDRARCTVSRSK